MSVSENAFRILLRQRTLQELYFVRSGLDVEDFFLDNLVECSVCRKASGWFPMQYVPVIGDECPVCYLSTRCDYDLSKMLRDNFLIPPPENPLEAELRRVRREDSGCGSY